uniref:Uncharacterized protein n=1 Tax=Gopherus evgoodei TaxID=1825980 RepID=A0A8C4YAA6_9SAUR
HSVEDAGRKQQDVLEEMEKTLQQMGEIDGCSQGRAWALMLKGKALNVTPDYKPQAEELLAKAVKLDPELVEAWNQLGEAYWKKGDITAAPHLLLWGSGACESHPEASRWAGLADPRG